jgi:hypothetical protein
MDLLLLCYATPIKKDIKNDSAVVNTKKWAFSHDIGSRCKFVIAGCLFDYYINVYMTTCTTGPLVS